MKVYKSLKSLNIPYEIEFTNELTNLLMRIAECRPFFSGSLSKPLKLSLIRNAKLRAITYSNQIEGNPLHEKEVQKVIRAKKQQDEKYSREIQNYSDALEFAEKLAMDSRPISINDFCDIQKLITSGLIETSQSGKIRTIPVSIINAESGNLIDDCPEPHLLNEVMIDLWDWLDNTQNFNPFLRAFAFHFIAVAIHPFADGNGRSVRLMQHLLLLRSGEKLVKYIPSETAIMRRRDDYYSVIRQTKKLGRLAPMLEFLASCFCEVAEEVTEEAKSVLKKNSWTPDMRREEILRFAKGREYFKTSDLINFFPDIPRRTLERDLKILCDNKDLIAKGDKKSRKYSLSKSGQ